MLQYCTRYHIWIQYLGYICTTLLCSQNLGEEISGKVMSAGVRLLWVGFFFAFRFTWYWYCSILVLSTD